MIVKIIVEGRDFYLSSFENNTLTYKHDKKKAFKFKSLDELEQLKLINNPDYQIINV